MQGKPTTAAGYSPNMLERVRATCLYVATKLGEMTEDVIVIGGLVPSLLIDAKRLPEGTSAHVGTRDLDIGLTLASLDGHRYRTLTERLRRAGFEQDVNDDGNRTRQRWRVEDVTVDFLIPPGLSGGRGGTLQNIEADFAAIVTPGLGLAFRDREAVTLSGLTIRGEKATRRILVCGPGAFVVLKSLAFRARGENKDAYDLFYVVSNFGSGVEGVAARLTPLLDDPAASDAVEFLRQDFTSLDGPGPIRAAEFMLGRRDDYIQAEVAAYINQLLESCPRP